MDKISATAYVELVQSSKILEKDGYGEKVLLTDNGQIVKIFRRKQLFSSAMFFPYVRRFAANAERLKWLDIHTITVIKIAQCCQPKRDLVWYEPIAGETLRNCCQLANAELIIETLAVFVAKLHHKGILFRSLHWGNIIVADDLSLGLIDIADIVFYRRPLTLVQRQRNFRHMLRYPIDGEIFNQYADLFWSVYSDIADLSTSQCQSLRQKVQSASKD